MSDEIDDRFRLSPLGDYDYVIGGPYKIGLFSWTPHDLRLNIAAAVATYQMGNKSIDNVRKNYFSDVEEYLDSDAPLKSCVRSAVSHIETAYRSFWPRSDSHFNTVVFDQALIRCTGTVEETLRSARRGHLFETALLARGALEQLAWARGAGRASSEEELVKLNATKEVTSLRGAYSGVGRFYGILSKYAHFQPDLHHWFYAEQDDKLATRFADSQTKIVTTSWVFLLSDILVYVFEEFYSARLEEPMVLSKQDFVEDRMPKRAFEKYYEDVVSAQLDEVRALFAR